jgi:hypothetical protein
MRRALKGLRGQALRYALAMVAGIGGHGGIGDLSRGVWPDAKKRRGGSGCGNGETVPRTGRGRPLCLPSQGDHGESPLQRRVGPSGGRGE